MDEEAQLRRSITVQEGQLQVLKEVDELQLMSRCREKRITYREVVWTIIGCERKKEIAMSDSFNRTNFDNIHGE